jgi:methionine-rich copper-binding protein CopC
MKGLRQATARIGPLLFLIGVVAVALTPAVFAQAKLRSSDPADGEVINREPDQISVTFTEDIDAAKSKLQVFYAKDRDAAQQPADNGDAKGDTANPDTMSVTMKDGLGDGVYFVKWHSLTKDSGAASDDQYDFTVDHAAAAGATTSSAGGCDPDRPCDTTDNTGLYIMLGVLGVVVVLAIAASVILVQRSRAAAA